MINSPFLVVYVYLRKVNYPLVSVTCLPGQHSWIRPRILGDGCCLFSVSTKFDYFTST